MKNVSVFCYNLVRFNLLIFYIVAELRKERQLLKAQVTREEKREEPVVIYRKRKLRSSPFKP